MRVQLIDEILLSVEKPARYTGNELNMILKNPTEVDLRFAFCFPDIYEIGMSHLGMRILYHVLNSRTDTYCERVFAPWVDMEERMRKLDIPLFALESKDSIDQFDILGFTLQYEMSYTNIINMLDLGKIPIFSNDRNEGIPFVCAGGPCAFNPEPLADFIDFFMIGEGEEVINEVMDEYVKWKKKKLPRNDFLRSIASIEGVYVPSLYDCIYKENGKIESLSPKIQGIPTKIKKRIIANLDAVTYPESIIVPFINIVHDRVMLEVFRGCIRGCRFCQAGFIYRPVREKSPKRLMELADNLLKNTGYDEISLTSLSTSDYTGLETLTDELIKSTQSNGVNIALPSLRVDSFSIELMEKVSKVRKSGLTFAPEAGSQRLRDVINKNINEEDILNSVSIAFAAGYYSIKLYFMLGLPTETNEDIEQIAILCEKVVKEYYKVPKEKRGKGLKVSVSTSFFVPKPQTPFQWFSQATVPQMIEKQKYLKSKIKKNAITYSWHDQRLSLLEAAIARGDRRIGKVLYTAYKKGCKFDSWNEHFKYENWLAAFEECSIDPQEIASGQREYDEILPWDHIDTGVSKDFLIEENEKAKNESTTPNCRLQCSSCGVIDSLGGC